MMSSLVVPLLVLKLFFEHVSEKHIDKIIISLQVFGTPIIPGINVLLSMKGILLGILVVALPLFRIRENLKGCSNFFKYIGCLRIFISVRVKLKGSFFELLFYLLNVAVLAHSKDKVKIVGMEYFINFAVCHL